MLYISCETIKKAYTELTSVQVNNSSILHIFLILKGCGINDLNYQDVSIISEKGLIVAHDLSMLFSQNEVHPPKYEFINPFSMRKWADQAPSEPLKKWVSSRIKNNIIGGATTWRKIINEDIYKNQIKFAYNYVDEIKELTIPDLKINLWAITLWYFKSTEFEKQPSPGDLIQKFIEIFHINKKELSAFFETSIKINLTFSENLIQMTEIRKMIGSHVKYSENWVESLSNIEEPILEYKTRIFKPLIMNNYPSIEKIVDLLKKNYQIILSGPPGTSKSYIAQKISEIFITKHGEESVLKIQFHPQFSYQDFIGGFIVRGENVQPNRGLFLSFIDLAIKNNSKEFLLIIDEINRANTSSVFGEVLQCLDRGYKSQIMLGGNKEEIQIPKNLYIIGTMNTADRTLGSMDFALRRRFVNIYIPPNEDELISLVELENDLSAKDFLARLNTQLRATLQNQELVIGQTIFYNPQLNSDNKFIWSNDELEDLFNYKILPIVEDYCNRDSSKITEILGNALSKRLSGEGFVEAFSEYTA